VNVTKLIRWNVPCAIYFRTHITINAFFHSIAN